MFRESEQRSLQCELKPSSYVVGAQAWLHSYQVGTTMCGLAGILGPSCARPELLVEMAASMAHRGPDDEGVWLDREAGIGLVHRRLAIVDLSPMGHQPMTSADG